ncbi:Protein SKG3 [Tolypocladium capitatum]|uniref:Protein SKG3 n=1 Tax=Tolypocladium capitatum TaxID=45235 RepID=A0A2K3QLY6_9HYPO|nr:Protein SKG3 [Tolypocladium capitatum]
MGSCRPLPWPTGFPSPASLPPDADYVLLPTTPTVLSFMSQFSAGSSKTLSPSPSPPNETTVVHLKPHNSTIEPFPNAVGRPVTPPSRPDYATPLNGSPYNANANPSPHQRGPSVSRPLSMVQAYQPPLMDIGKDTIPELQPIFSFLNSHSNKLYQEGYFLKLDDQNSQGKPNPDRTWTECFAQLVGTVLSLWDAAELDAAGEDGEVLPKFINLTDASIKMIESLPTRSSDEQPLQNILSISTAGRNRYLLHFNSHHSLIQWTAGIRLAMFEHSTLQEAYTGALIAGKGKTLNNINVIMERSRSKNEEWVRVRFGAGVPWRRCWCVISPPDEKEYAKLQKDVKKRSPYDRSPVPVLKGDIKFYDSRKEGKKQKKAQPIATITDAYSAYAIYPQAKSLVDASTLLKIEGNITVHSDPPSATEGFIFVMPETHPAVTGFEMLLRFLFPTWDTFGLYGRPGRLVASVLDHRSLMFAMPKHKRYGYLEVLDVSTLILEDGSLTWAEKEWRRKLKEATGNRMNAVEDVSRSHSRSGSRSSTRLSFGGGAGGRPRVGFTDDRASVRSSRSFSLNGGVRTDAAPADQRDRLQPAMAGAQAHRRRNSSDPSLGGSNPPRNDYGAPGATYHYDAASPQNSQMPLRGARQDRMAAGELGSSDEELGSTPTAEMRALDGMRGMQAPEPVSRPPAFNHGPQARPTSKAYHSPELRRANNRLSSTTLAQLTKAVGVAKAGDMPPARDGNDGVLSGPSVHPHANSMGTFANHHGTREALGSPNQDRPSGKLPHPPLGIPNQQPRSLMPHGPSSPYANDPSAPPRSHASDGRRSPYPPGTPRPPNTQQPTYRPDQSRPPPGGPGGPPPQQGRGRPPNQRPPPGNAPPYQDQYGNYGPGPGPRPHPGPQGRGGPPPNYPHRKPLPANSHQSLMPSDIIDHYVSDSFRNPPAPSERRPQPPPHQQGPGSGGQDNYYGVNSGYANDARGAVDRPRAGVLKTVGGGEPPIHIGAELNIPEVNFGPTMNYGAMSPPRKKGPAPVEPVIHDQARMQYHPEQGPNFAGRQSPGPQLRRARQDSDDPAKRTMAWQPGGSYAGSGTHGLTPQQYVQQRAAVSSPQYPHGGNLMAGSPGGMGPRTASPQLPYHGEGRGGGGPPPPPHGAPLSPTAGPAGSFSRPLRAGAQSPPRGQYGSGPGTAQNPRNMPPQFQGQAF